MFLVFTKLIKKIKLLLLVLTSN